MGETKKEILTRLKDIEAKLDRILSRAEVELTAQHGEAGGLDLAVQITGLARSSVYNLVSARQIPHYKKGKRLYFKRRELEEWIESGRRKTESEIRTYVRKS